MNIYHLYTEFHINYNTRRAEKFSENILTIGINNSKCNIEASFMIFKCLLKNGAGKICQLTHCSINHAANFDN